MAKFDGIQKQVFSAVQNFYGDALTWVPSNGNPSKSCLVLYNSPEAKTTLGDTEKYEYSPYNYSFEYFIDQLTGLKQAVDEGSIEVVNVMGKNLCVAEVSAKKDGKTLIAYCNEHAQ